MQRRSSATTRESQRLSPARASTRTRSAASTATPSNEIDWSSLSGRYVILVTDAGARGAQHPHSITRMGVPELRIKAQEQKSPSWSSTC